MTHYTAMSDDVVAPRDKIAAVREIAVDRALHPNISAGVRI